MTNVDKADEFAIRYYRWALEDFRQEVVNDFPRLRAIRNLNVDRLLNLMGVLRDAERRSLASGLVKRWNRRGLELAREQLNSEERHLVMMYDDRSPGVSTALAEAATDLGWDGAGLAARPRLRAALDSALGREVGLKVRGPTGRSFVKSVGSFEVYTLVDTQASTFVLSYCHIIASGGRRVVPDEISILNWMGISSQTTWGFVPLGDVDRVVNSLCAICKDFLSAVNDLLT